MKDGGNVAKRLRGALHEVAQSAPPAQTELRTSPRASVIKRQPALVATAGAAVIAVGVSAGAMSLNAIMANGATEAPRTTPAEAPLATPQLEMPPVERPPAEEATEVTGPPTSRFAVDEVAQALAGHSGEEGYGTMELDYETATVTVYWKGPPPKEVVEMSRTAPDGVCVELVDAEYNAQELDIANQQVFAIERKRLGEDRVFDQVAATMPNDDMSGIVVELVRGTAVANDQDRAADRYRAATGVPVEVRIVEERVVPAAD